ncbi:MAG: hypothetical protein Q7T57_01350 [Dehalococcoidales bacterium]|nr:hypothetical protein [Dehalococcoidales bacterium]
MTETWEEIQLPLLAINAVNHNKLLLNYVRPVVNLLQEALDSFHFFYEPGPCFLLRIRLATGKNEQDVWRVLENETNKVKELLSADPTKGQYVGEEKQFGLDGWPVVMRLFEAGSRLALVLTDNAASKGPEFHVGKLVHCFLNQLGYNTIDEANLHHQLTVERLLMAFGVFQKLENLKKQTE